jgi:hypothetical protein
LTTGSALPKLPQSVPRGLLISWLHWFASATACQVARPPVRIRLDRPAFGDFYFQAFNGSVSLSVAGYNYNNGWISLCWRDLHPLEWQLASLHGQTEKKLSASICLPLLTSNSNIARRSRHFAFGPIDSYSAAKEDGHSMTSSAAISKVCGTANPSVLATLFVSVESYLRIGRRGLARGRTQCDRASTAWAETTGIP